MSREAAFDLECFLVEWAAPNPVFDDLADACLKVGDPDRLADLARQALAAVDYMPDFATEPLLLATLEQALATVVPDLRATGLAGEARFVVLEGMEPPHAYVQYQGRPAGYSSGLSPGDAEGPPGSPDMLVLVAEELQEAVTESLFAAWPVCPEHQFGLHTRVINDQAVWWCSAGDGHAIAAIGNLEGRMLEPPGGGEHG